MTHTSLFHSFHFCDIYFLSFRFPCKQWLSRNQGDGSTERLLVAEMQKNGLMESRKLNLNLRQMKLLISILRSCILSNFKLITKYLAELNQKTFDKKVKKH